MTRFDTRIGAAVLAFLGAVYLALSLAFGHSARSELPPDLSVRGAGAGLEIWKAVAVALEPQAALVDVRPAEQAARLPIPGALREPEASVERLRELGGAYSKVLIVAASDEAAQKLVGEARRDPADDRFHYLVDGPRAWYLAFELPVPLFSEAAPPRGYSEALASVKGWFAKPDASARPAALEALKELARMDYQPTLLKAAGKKKQAGARKKISGGCG